MVCAGLLVGIFFSFELWFPLERTFPRAPFVFESPIWFERILNAILIISLISAMFFQKEKLFLITTIFSLGLLIFFDQNRLQPWVYQYFLIFTVIILAEKDEEKSLGLIQVLLAALYFWSGLQKLNFTFLHETLPKLFGNIFPEINLPFVFIGILIALIEIFTGIGLVFQKTRKFAVFSAIMTHTTILILLIAVNYNQIVWVWNFTLILSVFTAFWKSENSLKETFQTFNTIKVKSVTAVVAASILLPISSFFGLWDSYLSGTLYSGNVAVGVIRIDSEVFEKLPPNARQSVFQTKTGSEKMLPLVEWSLADLNVPVYPEPRVFRQIATEICKLGENKKQLELIVKERPFFLNGSFKVQRLNCEQLEK